jgi:ABC-type sugar transport system permease subunit
MVQASLPTGLLERQRRPLIQAGILFVVLLAVSYVTATVAERDLGLFLDTWSRLVAAVIGAGGVVASLASWRSSPHSTARRVTITALGVLSALILWFLYLTDVLVRATVQSVVIAIVVSAVVFVAANKWFDASLKDWRRFSALTGLIGGAAIAGLLVGNRNMGLFTGSGDALVDRSLVLVPVVAVLCGALGIALSAVKKQPTKAIVGAVGGGVIGLLIGAFFRAGSLPALEPVALLAGPLVGAGLFVGLARVRGKSVVPAAVTGAAFGWLIGAFGIPPLGTGSIVGAIVGTTVLGVLIGLRFGLAQPETMESRIRIERKARAIIFLAPALLFIAATLVIPTIRTGWLSLLDRTGGDFVGLDQYRLAFSDPNFYNVSRWAGIFVSIEFVVFAVILVIGLTTVLFTRRQIDQFWPPRLSIATAGSVLLLVLAVVANLIAGDGPPTVNVLTVAMIVLVVAVLVMLARYLKAHPGNSGISGGSGMALTLAMIFLGLALFTNLRGTLFNNIWWVFLVTILATGVGLAIAALSDGAKGESFAKAMIFMPMAISFVGASIIWRFMYIARPPTNDQTGVLNSLWVGLGQLATSGAAVPVAIGFFLLVGGLVLLALRGFLSGALGIGWGSIFAALPLGWIGFLFLTGNIGGVTEGPGGQLIPDPILFLSGTNQVGPYNNFFIMVPFIWIYTGFAMVILSAAIKGVPSDLIDACNVDGATESQKFWRVIVPQIAPTIGVVITTIIVTVMKVFDMVAVMTNGNFGTEVLANAMWKAAFTQGNRGLGSAIAVMLFLLVLPIMFLNIRRMQKEFH